MPSQSRALEASFEPSDKPAAPLGTDPGPMLEDFDSFFEKLNKLEPSDWRKSPLGGSEKPTSPSMAAGKASASLAGKKAIDPNLSAKSAAKVAAKSAMGDPLAGLRAAFAQAKKSQQGDTKLPGLRRKMPGAFRFALTALVLFAVGMGIGWAALSLPGKGGDAATASAPTPAPDKSLIVESKLDALLGKPASDKADTLAPLPLTETAAGTATAGVVVKTENSENAEKSDKSDPSAKTETTASTGTENGVVPVDLAAAHMADSMDDNTAEAKPDTSAPAITAAPVVAHSKAMAKAKPAKAISKSIIPAASVIPTGTDTAVSGGTHYAVQVGACRSTRCVENYRKLISAHLTDQANNIRVISVAADGKDTGVQRIRVAPLDKAAAQQLRAALIEADPRLSAAYVVEFRP